MNTSLKSAQSIQSLINEAYERYTSKNPLSHAQNKKASGVLPGGNTRTVLYSAPFPITLASAEGCYITSLDGHTYVDYLGEFTAGLYGHTDPIIREAIETALDNGWVRGGHIEQEEDLARLICDRFPSIDLVRFANSGTEANLYAIATARAVSNKNKIMVFEGGYHGGVLTFGSSASPLRVPYEFVLGQFNNWDSTESLLEENRNDLACVLIEPMQGSSGCIPASPEFLSALREWTSKHNIILIFDEVMTSRMSGGGLQEVYDIRPDLTTLGKYIGGGFSFGAFGGREDIMRRFDPSSPNYFSHAGTFNNNVFTMSAGAAGYGKVFTPDVARDLSKRGETLRARLNKVAASATFPMQFTGIGSLMNVHMCSGEIKSTRDTSGSNNELRDLFYFDMLESNIWPARRGMLNLSLPMGEVEFERLINAVEIFVEKRRGVAT
ncbi:aspartate aminotransferase family protein [Pusillimonas sp. ANT_WB101]|uniref:aspartate aminotransferase family protein n=1 Tax=Pusillimonas sp. ANT_WB101 TaxID=2597356 RepID=UPI0011F04606|nr:aminotransferase class III-fold pyridoxal phosphate-dependent enzyme [Pusillimonas sp. ANT_WB101]KAA0892579.1 aminotransferase class III-fold pyridoxal phosphate-dependent enzyme [Pusillimonas sp. ANT_WB101]